MGVKSDTIGFACALAVESLGKKEFNIEYVGYRFYYMGNEPLFVPVIPFKDSPEDIWDVDKNKLSAYKVFPGEWFEMNIVEAASLISRADYEGIFSGGEHSVSIVACIK